MSQKIAFITGGNRGLGFQTALELKDAGIKVVIGSRDLAQGEQAVAKLRAAGSRRRRPALRHHQPRRPPGRLRLLQLQVRPPRHSRQQRRNRRAAPFPATAPSTRAADVPLDLLHKVFETNFFAQVALTKALLPLIKKSPAGRIVNLSSILGSLTLHADPDSPIYHAKSFAYDASKTALNAFTVHLAYELRDTNIKVNSAHPGWVKTDMGGPQATMELSEGAKTSAALATLPDDGPTGGYFHQGEPIPW